jgi:GNAT superfamily N-acetyltransferase
VIVGVRFDPVLTPELRGRLVEIWVDVTNAGGAVGLVPPVTADDVEVLAAKAFSGFGDSRRGGRRHLLVLDVDGEPAAWLLLEGDLRGVMRHWMWVKLVQVHPKYQGTGLGRRLLEAAREVARNRLGLEMLRLTVRGGTGVERFYARLGWREVARIPGIIRVAPGDDRDEIEMLLVPL